VRSPDTPDAAPAELLLPAGADAFDAVAGRANPLAAVLQASRERRRRQLEVRWRVPLVTESVHRLEGIFSLAEQEGIDAVLLAPERPLDTEARAFAWDFVRHRLLEDRADALPPGRLAHYRSLERALTPEEAAGPGEQSGPRAQLADVLGVLGDGTRALLHWLLASTSPAPSEADADAFASVLLIGAYGGDHIGDAAILGGVLRRLHERFGTRAAVLMSQRPAHTRRLAGMLETPVALRVEAYAHDRIRACLSEAGAVVFAGGPLTDIPKQLVRHLYTVSLARRVGKPFRIEGIGVGPFPRWPSAWVGRRLLALAQHVSVRTAEDGARVEVRALGPEVGRDPAFDYLETRGAELTRIAPADAAWIERLLADCAGRPVVAVNARPINAMWTVGGPEGEDRAERTRQVQSRFEAQLAAGLSRFAAASSRKPRFVFYPMNAIHFGRSDLGSAYRIAAQLEPGVDFRVWQGDPSVDGVIALLRRVDVVIAMRFHAAIYALSQGRRVIGIDYRPGEKDKVGFLLSQSGQSDSCTRIDLLEAGWLLERLTSACACPREV